MKITVKFPGTTQRGSRNWKAVRAAALKNETFESKIFAAAERAAGPDQTVFAKESGRVGAWIVDTGSGKRMDRRKALQAALARFRI